MDRCGIIVRKKKDGSVFYINNPILTWAKAFVLERRATLQDAYVSNTEQLLTNINSNIGNINDHPLRYFRLLPYKERQALAESHFGEAYRSNEISQFMSETFGMSVPNPINLPIIKGGSRMTNALLRYVEGVMGESVVFPYDVQKGNNTIVRKDSIPIFKDDESFSYYEDVMRWVAYGRALNDQYREYFEEHEWMDYMEDYYPMILSRTDILPEIYDDLLDLIDAEDVSSIGRKHSIYVLSDAIIKDITNNLMLRFSDIDNRTMAWIEAIYQVLNSQQREQFAEMVNKGDTYAFNDIRQILSMGEEQVKETIHLLLRGLGFPNSPITSITDPILPQDIQERMISHDRVFQYAPKILNILKYNDLEEGILADIINASPFGVLLRDIKMSLLMEQIESGENIHLESVSSYLSYAEEQGMIRPLEEISLDVVRNRMPVSLLEDNESNKTNLLRYYYYGMLGKDYTDIQEFVFGRCQ